MLAVFRDTGATARCNSLGSNAVLHTGKEVRNRVAPVAHKST